MTRFREILVVEPSPHSARAARFARDGEGLKLVNSVRATGDTKDSAARAALAQLAAPGNTPVCLLTLDVTPACLDLPATASGLAPERLRELVRWEIEPLVPGSGELSSGWSTRAATGPSGARRLALGIRKQAIATWKAALPGSRLHALYPRGLGAVPLALGQADGVVLDLQPDAGVSAVVERGAIQSVRLRELQPSEGITIDQLFGLIGADTRTVYVSGTLTQDHRDGLERAGYTLHSLPEHASLEGVARHAFGLPGGDALAAVPAREPGPPLHTLPWARIAAGGLVVASGLLLYDALSLRPNLSATRASIEQLQHRTRPLAPASTKSTETRADVQAAIAQLEKQDAALGATHARLETEIVGNEKLPLSLLDGLVRATDEEVTIERVAQTSPGTWLLSGFGLTEVGVQRFAVKLNDELAGASMAVELLGERGDHGRLGLTGWSFELQVHRTAITATAAASGTPAPTTVPLTRRPGRH